MARQTIFCESDATYVQTDVLEGRTYRSLKVGDIIRMTSSRRGRTAEYRVKDIGALEVQRFSRGVKAVRVVCDVTGYADQRPTFESCLIFTDDRFTIYRPTN